MHCQPNPVVVLEAEVCPPHDGMVQDAGDLTERARVVKIHEDVGDPGDDPDARPFAAPALDLGELVAVALLEVGDVDEDVEPVRDRALFACDGSA